MTNYSSSPAIQAWVGPQSDLCTTSGAPVGDLAEGRQVRWNTMGKRGVIIKCVLRVEVRFDNDPHATPFSDNRLRLLESLEWLELLPHPVADASCGEGESDG